MSDKVFRIKGFRSATDSLHLNAEFADVTFVIEGERLPAHRIILATQNEYFRGMLFGGLRETTESDIKLNVPVEAFKLILKFIYTNEVELPYKDSNNQLKCDSLIEILRLANEYGVADIVKGVVETLTNGISLNNVLTLLKYAELYEFEELISSCYDFLDQNACNLLQQPTFLELPMDLLITLLKRDSFWAPESEIFTAVLAWQKHNSSTDLQLLLPYVRFSLFKIDFILETVKPLQLFTSDEIFEMIGNAQNVSMQKNKRTIPAKRPKSYHELADPGEIDQLFYAKKIVPDMESQNKLLIDLAECYAFNCIRFDRDVEDSSDDVVLDLYTTDDYLNWRFQSRFPNCRPILQHLTFERCYARCIRIDYINGKLFSLHNFEILSVENWRLPNIATETMGAFLSKGISVNGHNLLATPPFDKNIQLLSNVAFTIRSEYDSISIRFDREWPIYQIRARFLSQPKCLKIEYFNYENSSAAFEGYLSSGVLCKLFDPVIFAHTIRISGECVECTDIECLAIPHNGLRLNRRYIRW